MDMEIPIGGAKHLVMFSQMQRTLITIGMKSPVPLSKVGSMGLH